jgi:hypothetical protein
MTPLKPYGGDIDPAEIISAGSLTPPKQFPRGHWPRQNVLSWVIAETDFDDFRSDYLGEYEAICDTALARESGP